MRGYYRGNNFQDSTKRKITVNKTWVVSHTGRKRGFRPAPLVAKL